MGKLEESNKRKIRRRQLQQVILSTVKISGLIGVGLLAPNVIGALAKLGVIQRPRQREYVSSSASKLVRRGLLEFKNGHYEITKTGEKFLNRWELESYRFKKQKVWDNKWRMIIFDIPEKKKKTRMQVAYTLKQAGLFRLQDSVWVYPYDCEDIIGLLKTDFGVGKDILYIIADEIENDKHLRQEFRLL